MVFATSNLFLSFNKLNYSQEKTVTKSLWFDEFTTHDWQFGGNLWQM